MAERPKDLVYAQDEKPPAVPLITIGFQHVAVICPYLVMVALVAGAAKGIFAAGDVHSCLIFSNPTSSF
jgi:xanthine/uracil permease